MKRRVLLLFLLAATVLSPCLTATSATQNRIIVRTSLGSSVLSSLCLLQGCTVVGALDGTLNQVFLVTAPLSTDVNLLLTILRSTPGIVEAELDQLIPLVGGLNQLSAIPSGLSDTTPVAYFGSSVWNGYANQPAASIIHVSEAHTNFGTSGIGIIADIDTGVDPNHPALQPVLLPGYDFTRNQEGGSELNDITQPPPSGNPPSAIQVNQSTAAVLDQSTAAVLDGNTQYAAFGHGTMVLGVIHLVSPSSHLLPVKVFHSDGTAYLSDILRGIYYAVQNNANVINMSFDTKTPSQELAEALTYANQLNVVCAASAGNDGVKEIVYPASLQYLVMGVASTNDLDQRSSFSNFGNPIVWVAAPGEQIITTYPFSTYAATSGTSFSAPMVSGSAGLILALQSASNQQTAAAAIAHAVNIGPDMGNGRLDLMQTLQAIKNSNPGTGNPPPADFSLLASPSSQSITAGQSANFTVSVAPSGGFNQTVNWSCSGEPAESTCTLSPTSTLLDGSDKGSVTVNVTTTASKTSSGQLFPFRVTPGANLVFVMLLAGFAICFSKDTKQAPTSERTWRLVYGSAMVLTLFCVSCGSATTNTPPSAPLGTPAGTSMIVVTGTSGSLHHSTTIKLTVN